MKKNFPVLPILLTMLFSLGSLSASGQIPPPRPVLPPRAEKLPPPKTAAPYVFSATAVPAARETVLRAGWTDNMIDNQLPGDSPGSLLWRQTVKTALFGGAERFQADWDQLLSALSNPAILSASAEPGSAGSLLMNCLKTYDCLQAMPEWMKKDGADREALRGRLVASSVEVLNATGSFVPSDARIRLQAARLYAGILLGSATGVDSILSRPFPDSGLRQALYDGFNGEGLLAGSSLSHHVEVTRDLLAAAAALKAASPAAFQTLKPLFQQPVDIVAELVYPSGSMPGLQTSDSSSLNTIASLLEQGYFLFSQPKYAYLLKNLYQKIARPAEALLLNETPLPEKEKRNFAFETRAFPQTGAALLHSSNPNRPLSVFANSGLAGLSDSAPLLSIHLLTPQGPLSSSVPSLGTAGMNTVVINRSAHNPFQGDPNAPQNALIESIKPLQDGQTYLSLQSSGQMTERSPYPEIQPPLLAYQRTLWVDSPVVVDFFRVRGGSLHDYVYHGPGRAVNVSAGAAGSWSAPADEMPLLRNSVDPVEAYAAQGVYSVRFAPRQGQETSERLWLVDPAGSQLLVGSAEDHSFLVARRDRAEDLGDLYAAVHEIIGGTDIPETRVERIALSPASNTRDFQTAGIAVDRGTQTDLYLSSTVPDASYTAEVRGGRLVFQGTFGHVRLKDGQFDSLQLIGGKELRYDVHGVELKTPTNYGLIRGVHRDQGTLEIDFLNPLPSGQALRGESLLMLSNNQHPVMVQPILIESIQPEEAPQMLQVQNYPSFVDPRPSLGAPVTVGDTLTLEPHAELYHDKKDDYRVFSTVPAGFMIEAAAHTNRVLYNGSVLQRVRGQSKAGAIFFDVDPKEFRGGPVHLTRMP